MSRSSLKALSWLLAIVLPLITALIRLSAADPSFDSEIDKAIRTPIDFKAASKMLPDSLYAAMEKSQFAKQNYFMAIEEGLPNNSYKDIAHIVLWRLGTSKNLVGIAWTAKGELVKIRGQVVPR